MYLVFTRVPGESYRWRLRSLLYLCYVFRTLINSFVCGFRVRPSPDRVQAEADEAILWPPGTLDSSAASVRGTLTSLFVVSNCWEQQNETEGWVPHSEAGRRGRGEQRTEEKEEFTDITEIMQGYLQGFLLHIPSHHTLVHATRTQITSSVSRHGKTTTLMIVSLLPPQPIC